MEKKIFAVILISLLINVLICSVTSEDTEISNESEDIVYDGIENQSNSTTTVYEWDKIFSPENTKDMKIIFLLLSIMGFLMFVTIAAFFYSRAKGRNV